MSGWWLGLAGLVATGIAGGDGTTRWEVHSSLVLPRAIWLVHGTSGTVRVTEIELDLQLACTEQARDARTIRCLVEDAAMRAAPMPGDAGAILAIDEAGSRLTGATVILTVKRGQIRQVNLATQQPLVRSRSITRARDENLRLIVSRAMAGFDLKDAPDTEGAIWSSGARGSASCRRAWAPVPSARWCTSPTPRPMARGSSRAPT